MTTPPDLSHLTFSEAQALLDVLPMVILVLNPDGSIDYANQEALRQAGQDVQSLRGLGPGGYFRCSNSGEAGTDCGSQPACATCVARNTFGEIQQTRTPRHRLSITLQTKSPAGYEERDLLLSMIPLMDRVVLCAEDLTQHHRMQESVIAADRVQMINLMSRGISHRFNNLLAPVTGYLEMLVEDATLSERARTRIQRIREAVQTMAQLIRSMGRYSSRMIESMDDAVPVGDLARSLVEIMREANWNLEIQMSAYTRRETIPDLPAKLVVQMLLTLLVRAVDAVREQPDGRIEVVIDQDGPVSVLSVYDSGPRTAGFSAPHPFSLSAAMELGGDVSAQTPVEALGLTVVRHLADAAGGALLVEPGAAHGVTVTLRLPARMLERAE